MNTRRSFLRNTTATAAAFGFPTIIPAKVLGQDAPSKKIVIGSVGWGMQGPSNTMKFIDQPDAQVVAVCDVDKKHLETGVNAVNKRYNNQDCKGYHDFREMFARTDIDAVMLAVPDTWHAIIAIAAAQAKKDIWGEKPLARTIKEQQAIVRAVQKNNIIWQTGSWQRSETNFRVGPELVVNGLIGKLQRVEVGLPSGHNDFAKTSHLNTATPPPEHLDYDMWIGPSEMEDFIEGRLHRNWRWNYNIGGGQLLDWIGHHCDIAHWGMGMDRGGPVEVKPVQVDMPDRKAMYNTATKYRADATYENGVVMTIAGGHDDIKSGTKWIGEKGYVWVNRGGAYDSDVEGLGEMITKREGDKVVQSRKLPTLGDDVIKTRLYKSDNHWRNFLDCIKSRQPTVTPVETAHHSAIPGHLALIGFLTNSTVKWDPAKEVIVGNDAASALLGRTYRAPWKLEEV
jgi:predicted dehydrogenase